MTRWLTALLLWLLAQSAGAATLSDPADKPSSDRDRWYVVLFVVDGCSFCEMMRRQVIQPMLHTGELPEARFYEINMTRKDEWFFFDPMNAYLQKRALYRRYNLGLFPTTVILNDRAELLHPPLVGITTPQHFQKLLNDALSRLDRTKQ